MHDVDNNDDDNDDDERGERHSLSARDSIAPSRFSPRLRRGTIGCLALPFSIDFATLFAQIVRRPEPHQSRTKYAVAARASLLRARFLFWRVAVEKEGKGRGKNKKKKKQRTVFSNQADQQAANAAAASDAPPATSRWPPLVIIPILSIIVIISLSRCVPFYSRGATIYRLRAHRRHSAIRLMPSTCSDLRVPCKIPRVMR